MITENITRLIKNLIALFLSRLSPKLVSMLFVIYIARFLGAGGFGKFVLALGYFELFLALIVTGLNIIVTREIAKFPAKAPEYIINSVMLSLTLTVIASFILIALSHILPYSEDTRLILCLVCVALVPATFSMVFEAQFVGFQRAQYVTYGALVENGLRTMLWFMALMFGYNLTILFVILIITRIVLLSFYVVCYSQQISKFRWNIQLKTVKQMFTEWRVIAVENWLSSLIWSIDFIFLSILCGEEVVGLYVGAYKILNFADIGAWSYTVAIFPYMSRLFKESKGEFYKLIEWSIKYILILVIPSAIILSTIGERIIIFLYGKDFLKSIPMFSILIWVMIFRFLNPFLSHVLFARGEQRKSLKVAAISVIFYVPISWWFISLWGGVGAAWALLIVATLDFCLYFLFVWKDHGVFRVVLRFKRSIITVSCAGIAAFLLKDSSLILNFLICSILYLLLVIVLKVFSTREIEIFRSIVGLDLTKYGKALK